MNEITPKEALVIIARRRSTSFDAVKNLYQNADPQIIKEMWEIMRGGDER